MAKNNPTGLWHNPDWLHEQRANGLATYQIVDLAGCSRATIDHELRRLGLLQPRQRKPPQYVAKPEPELMEQEQGDGSDWLDCLDCPLSVTTCDGCAAYRARPERWVRG